MSSMLQTDENGVYGFENLLKKNLNSLTEEEKKTLAAVWDYISCQLLQNPNDPEAKALLERYLTAEFEYGFDENGDGIGDAYGDGLSDEELQRHILNGDDVGMYFNDQKMAAILRYSNNHSKYSLGNVICQNLKGMYASFDEHEMDEMFHICIENNDSIDCLDMFTITMAYGDTVLTDDVHRVVVTGMEQCQKYMSSLSELDREKLENAGFDVTKENSLSFLLMYAIFDDEEHLLADFAGQRVTPAEYLTYFVDTHIDNVVLEDNEIVYMNNAGVDLEKKYYSKFQYSSDISWNSYLAEVMGCDTEDLENNPYIYYGMIEAYDEMETSQKQCFINKSYLYQNYDYNLKTTDIKILSYDAYKYQLSDVFVKMSEYYKTTLGDSLEIVQNENYTLGKVYFEAYEKLLNTNLFKVLVDEYGTIYAYDHTFKGGDGPRFDGNPYNDPEGVYDQPSFSYDNVFRKYWVAMDRPHPYFVINSHYQYDDAMCSYTVSLSGSPGKDGNQESSFVVFTYRERLAWDLTNQLQDGIKSIKVNEEEWENDLTKSQVKGTAQYLFLDAVVTTLEMSSLHAAFLNLAVTYAQNFQAGLEQAAHDEELNIKLDHAVGTIDIMRAYDVLGVGGMGHVDADGNYVLTSAYVKEGVLASNLEAYNTDMGREKDSEEYYSITLDDVLKYNETKDSDVLGEEFCTILLYTLCRIDLELGGKCRVYET